MSDIKFIYKEKFISSSSIINYVHKNYQKSKEIYSLKEHSFEENFSIFIKKFFLCEQMQLFNEINCIIRKFILDITYKLILNLRESNILEYLFAYINRNTTLSHVTLNGLPYYERSNMWDNITIETRPKHDPDVKCNQYDGSCDAKPTIKVKKTNNLQYIVEITDDDCVSEYENSENENIQQYHSQICDYIPSEILLVGYDEICITNGDGINKDHRGSTHCAVDLKYEPKVEFKDLITLHDLTTTFYRVKSHKFDKGYELFCGVKSGFILIKTNVKSDNKNPMLKNKYRLVCSMDFDHGS